MTVDPIVPNTPFTEFQNESQAKRADRRAELYKEEQKPESDAPIIKSAPTGDAADASSGSEAKDSNQDIIDRPSRPPFHGSPTEEQDSGEAAVPPTVPLPDNLPASYASKLRSLSEIYQHPLADTDSTFPAQLLARELGGNPGVSTPTSTSTSAYKDKVPSLHSYAPQVFAIRLPQNRRRRLATLFNLEGYLSVQSKAQPWAPLRLGQSGVLLQKNQHPLYLREMFAYLEGGSSRYLGQYAFQPLRPLTRDEWLGLEEPVKQHYCNKLNKKIQDAARLRGTDVRKEHDEGKQIAHCVLARCIGFNRELFDGLKQELAASQLYLARSIAPSTPSRKRKRRREPADDGRLLKAQNLR